MAKLINLLILAFSTSAVALGTYHKTPDGKYPHYYVDSKDDDPWDDVAQAEYDQNVDDAIERACFDSALVEREKNIIADEKAVGKKTGIVNAQTLHDAGSMLITLNRRIEERAKIIKERTGKPISSYPCQD